MSTENGAPSLSNTGSKRLNLFSKMTRDVVKNPNFQGWLEESWEENKLDTLKILFHSRDCRGGKGDRAPFLQCMRWLITNNLPYFLCNCKLIPYYGRWKDILELFPVCENLTRYVASQLREDLEKMNKGNPISLCAKWMKENTGLCTELGISKRELRKKYLVPLRTYLQIVEQKMCGKKWGEIDFSKVPSVAMNRLKKAFKTHTPEKFQEWLSLVAQGKSKINAKQLYPHDLVRSYMLGGSFDQVVEEQWKVLEEESKKLGKLTSTLVLSDVSSSMSGTPMEVSIALGVLISSIVDEPFKNLVITFETNPKFHMVKGTTLCEKVRDIMRMPWGGSTNILAVFDMILERAKTCGLSSDKMPKHLIILSDMQFNQASNSNGTTFQIIGEKYKKSGYEMPKICFWNLRSDTTTDFPVSTEDENVCLVSGYSQSNLLYILEGKKYTPYDVMRKTLDNQRYSLIKLPNCSEI